VIGRVPWPSAWAPDRLLPVAAFAALAASFVFELMRHLGTAGDFWTFWAASRATAAGLDPYLRTSLTAVASLPAGPRPGSFLSPLALAVAMEPLGALPLGVARLAWFGIGLVTSAALLLLLLRLGNVRLRWWTLLGGTALLLAFQPYDLTLWLGQTDIIIAAAIAGGWVLLRRGRPYAAGLAVALAAIDVHLILGVGAYFTYTAFARRDARPLVGLGAGLLVLSAPSLLHPADLAQWVAVALPHAQRAAIEPWDTLSVLQAGSEMLGRTGGWALAAIVGVGMLGLAVAAWGRGAPDLERDLAVTAALTLGTTTFAYSQDYLLLGPGKY